MERRKQAKRRLFLSATDRYIQQDKETFAAKMSMQLRPNQSLKLTETAVDDIAAR